MGAPLFHPIIYGVAGYCDIAPEEGPVRGTVQSVQAFLHARFGDLLGRSPRNAGGQRIQFTCYTLSERVIGSKSRVLVSLSPALRPESA